MTKIVDVLTKENGRGINHFRHGYSASPLSMLLFYDMSALNNPKFDFNSAKVKHAKIEKTKFADATKVIWYEDSIKESSFTATETESTATFTISIATLQVGDQLRNKVTGDSMVVIAIPTPGTITVDANTSGVTSGDEFIRWGFAKTYGEYSVRGQQANDYIPYDNYVQFVSAEIPSDKTDVLTNNIDRLFYPTTNDYIAELYAEASRIIVKTIVFSLFAGVSQQITLPSGKKIYTAGGLEFYIPSSALNKNIKGAGATPELAAKATLKLLRDQVVAAYKSGVEGITALNRLMVFVNYAMSSVITDALFDAVAIQMSANDKFESFGINLKSFDLNGYKVNIVEEGVLDALYDTEPTGFIVDTQGIILYNLSEGVINADSKTVSALGASTIFCPAQTTYEMREISLNTNFTWVFKNISSGCFRKIIYK